MQKNLKNIGALTRYSIISTERADNEIAFFQKTGNKSLLKKIGSLLDSIELDPYKGIGNPEALKYELSGYYSRRINREHRMIYSVNEEEKIVEILSIKGHY